MVSWVVLVFMAGSADRVNVTFGIGYVSQIWVYRVLIWVLPVVLGFVSWWVCRALQASELVVQDRHSAEAEARLARARGLVDERAEDEIRRRTESRRPRRIARPELVEERLLDRVLRDQRQVEECGELACNRRLPRRRGPLDDDDDRRRQGAS